MVIDWRFDKLKEDKIEEDNETIDKYKNKLNKDMKEDLSSWKMTSSFIAGQPTSLLPQGYL